jgi:hypothetical protein
MSRQRSTIANSGGERLAIYNTFPDDQSSEGVEGEAKLFSERNKEQDFELPANYINPRLAIREAVQMLEAYQPGRLADIATGMILMVSQMRPQHLKILLQELEASPVTADTADARLESLHFLNSHDRNTR